MRKKIKKYELCKPCNITKEQLLEVSAAVGRVCDTYKDEIDEYHKQDTIISNSYIGTLGGSFSLIEVFESVNNIYKMTGSAEPFALIEQQLKQKVEYAERYINEHKYDKYLCEIYHFWVKNAKWIDGFNPFFAFNNFGFGNGLRSLNCILTEFPEYFIKYFGNEIEILEKNLR